jgi:hypothetical protein
MKWPAYAVTACIMAALFPVSSIAQTTPAECFRGLITNQQITTARTAQQLAVLSLIDQSTYENMRDRSSITAILPKFVGSMTFDQFRTLRTEFSSQYDLRWSTDNQFRSASQWTPERAFDTVDRCISVTGQGDNSVLSAVVFADMDEVTIQVVSRLQTFEKVEFSFDERLFTVSESTRSAFLSPRPASNLDMRLLTLQRRAPYAGDGTVRFLYTGPNLTRTLPVRVGSVPRLQRIETRQLPPVERVWERPVSAGGSIAANQRICLDVSEVEGGRGGRFIGTPQARAERFDGSRWVSGNDNVNMVVIGADPVQLSADRTQACFRPHGANSRDHSVSLRYIMNANIGVEVRRLVCQTFVDRSAREQNDDYCVDE